MVKWFLIFTIECSNHSNIIFLFALIKIGGYSSIGRATVCGTVSSLFKPGYPPFAKIV